MHNTFSDGQKWSDVAYFLIIPTQMKLIKGLEMIPRVEPAFRSWLVEVCMGYADVSHGGYQEKKTIREITKKQH